MPSSMVPTPTEVSILPSDKDPEQMTGPELIKYIAQFPTIDHYLDRDPFAKPLTDAELILLTRTQRAERSLFNVKEQKRKDKKAGVPTDETGESDDGTSD